ncbi:hypothetical protein OS493_032032 [Desmophyllum pertusum]|uniref:Uncharacterized protein n=1 Tax=Desmophyllum pertusum TaxID=174260 RepID=A0A9X0CQG5_9CNID|nr:hypothetical protein OS493_032032 [Desmophyllum pertusum]
MMKTLEEDKRGLERNIQEFQRYYQQKCNYFNAELDHERTLGAEHRIRANAKNISSVYNSHEQKRATLQHKGSKFAHDDYAKLERGSFESGLNAGESLRERKKDVKHIFRGHLSKKRQEELTEAGAQRQFHASVKSTNESADLEWNRHYESQYRECCHEQNALKTLFMAAEERIAPVAEMEDDLDDSRSAEYKNISEEYRRDVDGVRSENDAVDIEKYSLANESQALKQEQVVSNSDEMAASSTVESEFTNGHTSPIPGEDENDSVTKVAAGGLNSLKTRKEELEQLCEVLMEERNRATGSLKEREDEVLRLRLRSVETEHEKVDLKTQLAKVLGRSDLLKNELESTKEENEKLRAEVERLRKRIKNWKRRIVTSNVSCKRVLI